MSSQIWKRSVRFLNVIVCCKTHSNMHMFSKTSSFSIPSQMSWCRRAVMRSYINSFVTLNKTIHTGRIQNCDHKDDVNEFNKIDGGKNMNSPIEETEDYDDSNAEIEVNIESKPTNNASKHYSPLNEKNTQKKVTASWLHHSFSVPEPHLKNEVSMNGDFFSSDKQVEEYLISQDMNFKTGYTCHYTVCPKLGKLAMNKLKENDRLYINSTSGNLFICIYRCFFLRINHYIDFIIKSV